MDKEWLTAKEARELLGVSRSRLYQLVEEGRLTPYQSGLNKRFRFSRGEIEALSRLQPVVRPGPKGRATGRQASQSGEEETP